MIQAFIIHKEDNVAIVAENVKAGQEVGYVLDGETVVLTAKDDIPIYHKIASREIAKGQQVLMSSTSRSLPNNPSVAPFVPIAHRKRKT